MFVEHAALFQHHAIPFGSCAPGKIVGLHIVAASSSNHFCLPVWPFSRVCLLP